MVTTASGLTERVLLRRCVMGEGRGRAQAARRKLLRKPSAGPGGFRPIFVLLFLDKERAIGWPLDDGATPEPGLI